MVVDRRRGRLQDKDFAPAHWLLDAHRNFTVREPFNRTGSQLHAECARDASGQLRIGRPGEDGEVTLHR
jgi:hypothetical protein